MNCPDCDGKLNYIGQTSWIEDDGITRIIMIGKQYQCLNCGQAFEKEERSANQFDDTPEFYDYD